MDFLVVQSSFTAVQIRFCQSSNKTSLQFKTQVHFNLVPLPFKPPGTFKNPNSTPPDSNLSFSWHGKIFFKIPHAKAKKETFNWKWNDFSWLLNISFPFFFRRLEELFSFLHQPNKWATIVRDHLSFLVSLRARSPQNKKSNISSEQKERIHYKGWNWKRFEVWKY